MSWRGSASPSLMEHSAFYVHTTERAARTLLALHVQGLAPGSQRLREGQGWEDRMGPALRQGVPRQVHPVRLEGALHMYRRPKHDAAKFAPRGSEGIMLGHHLEPGGFFKGDYLVLNIDNLVSVPSRSTIYRVMEVARAPGPNEYPLRDVLREKRARDMADIVEDGILETLGEEEDVEQQTLEEIEDMERMLALGDEIVAVECRIPRAARIYMPRIGPPPRPPLPDGHLDDSTAIKFNIENPKRPASRACEVYELYKTAKSVGEARRLGASTGHIKYDLGKGYAKLEGLTAVVCVGPSHALADFEKQDPEAVLAAPLLEA